MARRLANSEARIAPAQSPPAHSRWTRAACTNAATPSGQNRSVARMARPMWAGGWMAERLDAIGTQNRKDGGMDASPSSTAIMAAVVRAQHRIRDDHPWVLDDPFAQLLVGPAQEQLKVLLDTV